MLLNGAALNGAPLNGGTFHVVEGAASIGASAEFTSAGNLWWDASATALTGTAEVSATCNGWWDAAASVDGSADFSCTASHTLAGSALYSGSAELIADAVRGVLPEVVMQCTGELYARADHMHAAEGVFDASAEVLAYVIRLVDGAASFDCQSLFDAVAQGAFGAADSITGTAELTADITRIIFTGQATADCTGELTAVEDISRGAFALIELGTAELHAGYDVLSGGITTCYTGAAFDCSAEFDTDLYVFFNVQAVFDCPAQVAPEPFQEQWATALFPSTAEFTCNSARFVTPESIDLGASAELAATASRDQFCAAIPTGEASIVATALVEQMGSVAFDAAVELIAEADHEQAANSEFGGSAEFAAEVQYVHQAVAPVDCQAEVRPDAIFFPRTMAEANIDGAADIAANPINYKVAAALVYSDGEFVATAYSNAEALDPDERTMYRSFVDREMVRPFVDREMREAA